MKNVLYNSFASLCLKLLVEKEEMSKFTSPFGNLLYLNDIQ